MEGISEHDGPLQLLSSVTVIVIVIIIIACIHASVQELLLIEWVSQSTHPVVVVKLEKRVYACASLIKQLLLCLWPRENKTMIHICTCTATVQNC